MRDVEFASTSSRDLLPFYGKLHIAYIPRGGVVLGLSKVARLAKLFSRRLTTQRELTRDLLAALDSEVRPAGACVLVEATHLVHGSAARRAVTTACSGVFLNSSPLSPSSPDSLPPSSPDSPDAAEGPDVEEFLDLLRLSGVDPLAGGWESESGENCGSGSGNAPSTSSSAAPPLPGPKEQQQQQQQQRTKGGRPSARPASPGEVVVIVRGDDIKEDVEGEEEEEEEEGGVEAATEEEEAGETTASAAADSSSSSPPPIPVTPGLENISGGQAEAASAPSAKEAATVEWTMTATTTATTTTSTPSAPAPLTPGQPSLNGAAATAIATTTTTAKTTANGTRKPPSCSSSVFGEDGSESDFGGGGCGCGGGAGGESSFSRRPQRDDACCASSSSSTAALVAAAAGTPRALAQGAGSFSFVHGGEIAAANRSRRRQSARDNDGSSDDGGDAAAAAAALMHLPVLPAAAARRSPPLAPGTRQAMEDAVRALLAEVVGGGGKEEEEEGEEEESSRARRRGTTSSSNRRSRGSGTRLAALEGAPRRYVEFLLASTAGFGAAPDPPTPAPGTFSTRLPRSGRVAPCGCGDETSSFAAAAAAGNASASSPSLLPFATPDRPTFDPSVPDFEAVLRFTSQCEHHMLPFHGVARLAVVGACRSLRNPGGPLLLPSLREVEVMVAAFSHRLQIQERLTKQLANGLVAACSEEGEEEEGEQEGEGGRSGGSSGGGKRGRPRGPAGVLVVCEAAHLCMVSRGVEKHASSTVTLAGRGVLASGAGARRELLRRLAALEAS